MYTRQTKIINVSGLHARPATEFVEAAKKYGSTLTIQNLSAEGALPVNAKSILRVLSAGLCAGCAVELSGEGEDEIRAVDALMGLIDSGFGEPLA